jgi:hypothetical protein
MADFRLCSTCESYSQASIYHYALPWVSVPCELTFARFRYSLGSHRPSQTTHLSRSPYRVRHKRHAGWYFKDAIAPTYPTQRVSSVNNRLQ